MSRYRFIRYTHFKCKICNEIKKISVLSNNPDLKKVVYLDKYICLYCDTMQPSYKRQLNNLDDIYSEFLEEGLDVN